MTATVTAYVGLGANLGDPLQALREAIQALARLPQTRLGATSSFYLSAPVDAGGDDYVNAVVCLQTALGPHPLLDGLQAIEARFGRERSFRNAPRTLDLDLLLYGRQTLNDERLQLPHPRMTERAFVLLPLLELDPAIDVPGLGAASDFLPAVREQAIRRLADSAPADGQD